MALVYLAGPMDYCDVGTTHALRERACSLLEQRGCAVFDPTTAYCNAVLSAGDVMAVNDATIERADALLAIWPPDIMSVGTPYEIFYAQRIGKPVVVVGPSRSLQLAAMNIPVYPLEALGEAIKRLADLMAGQPTPICSPIEEKALRYVGDAAHGPVRGVVGDAGLDMFASSDTFIPGHGFADVPLGVRIELPPNTWGMLTGRSSTIRNRGLLVSQGVIDNGYRGPMLAGCWNLEPEDHLVQQGDRIAQLIVLPLSSCAVVQVGDLAPSDRGTAGFGSTGT